MDRPDRPQVDPELKRRIQELISYKGGGYNPDLVSDIIENALKLLTDVSVRGDTRVIQTAVRELRYAFKLFEPHAGTRKVTIFGSPGRHPPNKNIYRRSILPGRLPTRVGWLLRARVQASCRLATKAQVLNAALGRTSDSLGNRARIQ